METGADPRVVVLTLDDAIDACFDDSSRSSGPVHAPPRFVMVCGTPASGKTRLRHDKYQSGYVNVDAGDIFRRFPNSAELDFPGELEWMLDSIGTGVARKAVQERRHIVTEVFGRDQQKTIELLEAMKAAGYTTEVVGLTNSVEQSVAWNESRSRDNISSYYTDQFNVRWLKEAALICADQIGEA